MRTDLDRLLATGYVVEFDERFDAGELDRSRWIPRHLPQWSTAERSAARYALVDGVLHLLIEADQDPWAPAYDGDTRVSSLQTGVLAGPLGSAIGQHRFRPDAVVCEEQENRHLYAPHFGVIATRARATADPACMVALWMIGYEDTPEHSAEICVCEIFGTEVAAADALVGMGVHPFGDPSIVDDFEKVPVAIDVGDWHEYAVEWTPSRVRFFVDGAIVKTVEQAPQYPMQLMLGIYAFGPLDPAGEYPKRFAVDWVRGYRLPD